MLKNKSQKIILTVLSVVLLSFIIISVALIIKPSMVGIVVDRIKLEDGTRELIYDTNNLKLLQNLTSSALFLGIALFGLFVAFIVLRLFFVNEETKEKFKKLSLMLLITGMAIAIILIAYYIFVLIRFPKDYDKYNNYAFSLGVANIIFLVSLIALSTLGIWQVFTNQKEDNKNTINVKILTEGAMMVALSVVLSVTSDLIGLKLPNGGSVSLSMLPIFIFAFRRGPVQGALIGLVYSIINLLIDGILHWGSIFFDYLIPYALLGFIAGLFIKKAQKGLIGFSLLGVFLGGFARYLSHSLSGMIFFSQYAPEGMTAFYYSFIVYNAPYMAINSALNMVIIALLHKRLINLDSRVV